MRLRQRRAAGGASANGLSDNELSWVLTLNVEALDAISPCEPTLVSPTWVTAPNSPSSPNSAGSPNSPKWPTAPSLPVMTLPVQDRASKAQQRRTRNRLFAKACRDKRNEHMQAMEARVVQIELENALLRAQVEREQNENQRLKEGFALDAEMSECA